MDNQIALGLGLFEGVLTKCVQVQQVPFLKTMCKLFLKWNEILTVNRTHIYNVYYISGIILNTSQVLTHLFLITAL